jgi:hypothetical protein
LAAPSIAERLKGRILLQVESRGEAYYVNPATAERYYMENGDAAYNVMRNLGVGITNADLEKIKNNKTLALKHKGKIFLQVESHGEAYYVDFSGSLHYLKDGSEAYNIMRTLGLGITTRDLEQIPSKILKLDQTNDIFKSQVDIIYSDSGFSPQIIYAIKNQILDLNFINNSNNNILLEIQGSATEAEGVSVGLAGGPKDSRVFRMDTSQTGEFIFYNSLFCRNGFEDCRYICKDNTQLFVKVVVVDSTSDLQNQSTSKTPNWNCSDSVPTSIATRNTTFIKAPNQDWLDEQAALERYYPIITSITDDKGGINKTSAVNNVPRENGDSWNKNTLTILKSGDVLTLTLNAKDPLNRPLLYAWASNLKCPGVFNLSAIPTASDFTTNNTLTCAITSEGNGSDNPLKDLMFIGYIKSEKVGYRSPDGFDDSISLNYNNDLPYIPFLP